MLRFCFFIATILPTDADKTVSGEYIMRRDSEHELELGAPIRACAAVYPWQKEGTYCGITKEHFRCKGSPLNPPNIITKDGKEANRFYDCSGADRHSLPLRDGKEYIYPILITLLNHVQKVTGKTVIVTSGHRCIAHQAFLDPTAKGSNSKHLIGAEVDFYLQGLASEPQKAIDALIGYYKGQPKEYETFARFDKSSDVATKPWLNKEIFIKLYTSGEGRSSDNPHNYPFIAIQVRYDREKDEKVVVTNEQAQKLLRK